MIERYKVAEKLGIEVVNADIMGCLVADIMRSAHTWLDLGSGRGEFSFSLMEKNSLLNIWNLERRPDYAEAGENARRSLPPEEAVRIHNVIGRIERVSRGHYDSEGISQNSMDAVSVNCYEPGKVSERNIIKAITYVLKPDGHAIITLDDEPDDYKRFLQYLNGHYSRVIISDHPVVYPQTSYTFALWHRRHAVPPFIWVRR